MLCALYFTFILFLFFAVTVCECHIKIKDYLLTYLVTHKCSTTSSGNPLRCQL